MPANLTAGALSAIAGLLVFLIIHHFWIMPIWFILPPGLLIAGLGGLAVGWAYAEIQAGLPPRPWTSLALFAVIAAILAPAILLAQWRAPLMDMSVGTIPPDQVGRVVKHFIAELVIPSIIVGGLAGWWLGRSQQAAIATAVAGLVFALGPGHNIPLLGNTAAAGKGVALLIAITLVSAWVLVEVNATLAKVE